MTPIVKMRSDVLAPLAPRVAPGFRRSSSEPCFSFVNMCNTALDGLPARIWCTSSSATTIFVKPNARWGALARRFSVLLAHFGLNYAETYAFHRKRVQIHASRRSSGGFCGKAAHKVTTSLPGVAALCCCYWCSAASASLLALWARFRLRLAAVIALHAVVQPDSQRRSMQSAEHAAGNATPPRRKCALCAYGSAAVTRGHEVVLGA